MTHLSLNDALNFIPFKVKATLGLDSAHKVIQLKVKSIRSLNDTLKFK